MAHPLSGQVQRLREDVITSGNERDLYQRNAPQVEAGLYLVPTGDRVMTPPLPCAPVGAVIE